MSSTVSTDKIKQAMCLYAITDRMWLGERSLTNDVELALKGGATCVQLREKILEEPEFLVETKEICLLAHKYNVPFIVNDDIQVAMACDADGIHVGQQDICASEARKLLGADKIIGVSAQTVQQAVEAEKMGADYLGVGAVFSTSTKLDAIDVSSDTLKKICKAVNIPVVAIGGINEKNVMQLSGSGVDGIAVVSALFAEKDILGAAEHLRELSERMIQN